MRVRPRLVRAILQAQYVFNLVPTWRASSQETSGSQGSGGESVSTRGAMNEFDPLTQAGEEDGVFSHDISAPDGMESDLCLGPWTDTTVATMSSRLLGISPEGFGDPIE